MNFILRLFTLHLILVSIYANSYAQSGIGSRANLQTDSLSFIPKVKITGYIQPQFQMIQSDGATTISGGNFETNTNNRTVLRRGKLKATFNSKNAEYVFQINTTEKGVLLDEIYLVLAEPWFRFISLTTGIFDNPLGYEISYSTTKLEFPERSRIMKALSPNEKDFGVMLTFQAPEPSNFHFITLKAGLFNGTGPTHRDFDNRKDLIVHLFADRSAFENRFNYHFGVSIQKGGFDNHRNEHYKWTDGFKSFPNDTLAKAIRDFNGLDAECSYNWLLGKTQIRSEYLFGIQSSTFSNNKTPDVSISEPAFYRSFTGGYIFFMHLFPNNKIQLVAKYDWYDPNSKVGGNQIGLLAKTGSADINYTTFGFGMNYYLNQNIKILGWYEFIKNESTSIAGFKSDLKDNLFTFRIQYKF